MAVTQNSYTGTGSQTTFSFTFPYLKASDIKASLDAVDTTAFTLPTATTLQFNTAPANGVKIKIFRETATDNLTATFYAGSAIKSEDLNENFTQNLYSTQEISTRYLSNLGGTMVGNFGLGEDADIVFEGASDNANETTITVADPTADRTITFPNVSGNVVTTGDTGTVTSTMLADGTIVAADLASDAVTTAKITDGNVTTAKLGADAVTGAKIADDQINSEHYVDASIDTAHIADSQITNAKMADNSVNTAELVDDAVTAAKLASNSVVSASIVDGTIVTGDIANNAITNAKMADDSVGAAELVDTSVGTAALASNAVTNAKMADNAVGTSELVNDSVTTVKIANSQVTTAKIADSNVTTAKINNDAVTSAKIVDNAVGNEHLQNDSVRTAEIQASAVTTAKIANDAINGTKIADDSINSEHYVDGSIGTVHIADGAIQAAKMADNAIGTAEIANNAVTTDKITDAELKTLAGMQSGTASILASSTALTATTAELNLLDGKSIQTTIADNDAQLPTSGAIVDYVTAQIAPLGGLEVIATEVAFPNTQPASGVVISISDAGGIVVNGSGVSTTGRTVGGSTVTINGFPSSVQSSTLAASMGLMVSSTGSSQTYTYHKLLGKESDIVTLSDDINDFNNRYRVSGSAPTSSLDNGDLWFDTTNGKMMVYNSSASAWEEVSAIGSFNINTLSSSGSTGGGSATFNGTAYRFTLSNPPQDAQQLLVSINGVVQKPNSGTSQPSEGFAISGNDIIFSAAPASGSISFIVTLGQSVQIGTPSDNTISTAKIQNLAVTGDKVATNLDLADNKRIRFGTGNDLEVYHDGTDSRIANTTGNLIISDTNGNIALQAKLGEESVKCIPDAAVELYYDNDRKLRTVSNGVYIETLSGDAYVTVRTESDNNTDDAVLRAFTQNTSASAYLMLGDSDDSFMGGLRYNNSSDTLFFYANNAATWRISPNGNLSNNSDTYKLQLGLHEDIEIYHDGSNSYVKNATGDLIFQHGSENLMQLKDDGAVELYYDNAKKFETASFGVRASDSIYCDEHILIDNDTGKIKLGTAADLQIYHDGSNSVVRESGTGQLQLESNTNIVLGTQGIGETYAQFSPNAAVTLYYNNSAKIATTNTGATVTGTIAAGSATLTSGSLNMSSSHMQFSGNTSLPNVGACIFRPVADTVAFGINNGQRVSVNQHGLLFGTDTAAANALDDYEEGTFTPGWFDDGGSFVSSYGVQYGQYTKIGNVVYFCFGLRINSYSRTPNSSQICRVGNLPFNARTVSDDEEVGFTLYARLWGSGTPPKHAFIRQATNSNHVEFYMEESQTGNDHILLGTDFDTSASCRVIVNGFYYTS